MRAKKIVISYFFHDDSIPLGVALANAFRKNGFQVATFHSQDEHTFWPFLKHINKLIKVFSGKNIDITQGTRFNNQTYREVQLERLVNKFDPDILLVIRGNSYSKGMLQSIKKTHPGIDTIGWWVKDPRNDNQLINDAKLYNHYFCMHKDGYTANSGIEHLPALGVYSDLYRKLHQRLEINLSTDICFVGGQFPRRKKYITSLTSLELEIYGPGWRKGKDAFNRDLSQCIKKSFIWGEDLVELYNNSKIVLNISQWSPNKRSGQNLRLFDVPSCGAFLLTDYSEELLDFFEPGVEIETFESPEELSDKVKYYLSHPVEREKIARRGYEKSLELPSYSDRVQQIIKSIEG
ncbi:MAG: glycosyltransferase family 1 protein [Candidatus Marinimicrobia bacterium]|jgi:spore maturation protein CgeB|nr:glycosyltransferase family 1 protein [Candidatus Neomarinimicrobiota bacterium]